jgi:hypothetical protein
MKVKMFRALILAGSISFGVCAYASVAFGQTPGPSIPAGPRTTYPSSAIGNNSGGPITGPLLPGPAAMPSSAGAPTPSAGSVDSNSVANGSASPSISTAPEGTVNHFNIPPPGTEGMKSNAKDMPLQ